jgi:hypothetical protein
MIWNMCGELFDFERHLAVARQRVRIGRELGALSDLPIALSCLAWNELQTGRVDTAEAMMAEAIELAAATDNPSMPGARELMSVATLSWGGHAEETRPPEAILRGQRPSERSPSASYFMELMASGQRLHTRLSLSASAFVVGCERNLGPPAPGPLDRSHCGAIRMRSRGLAAPDPRLEA